MINVHHLLGMAVLLGLSGLFSASETALFSLSRRHLRQLERTPTFAHGLVIGLRSDPESLLTTVLFGNMLVNVLYYCLATVAALAAAGAGRDGWAYALGGGSLIALVIGGEVVPKAIAVAAPMRCSCLAAVPLSFFQKGILPVRWLLRGVSRASRVVTRGHRPRAYVTPEELQLLIRATGERGVIALAEQDMMHEIIEFAEIRVREVMIPRVDVVACEISDPIAEFRKLVERTGIAKMPVYEDNIDNVVGTVDARDVLLREADNLRECIRPVPLFVPETAQIERVLHQFRRRKCQFAVAVDEYGGWAGIVTLEDIIEEIVGDISDEFDAKVEAVREIDPDTYVLSGSVSIRDWSELFGLDVELAEVETLGGFIVLRLGRLPHQGDSVELGNLRFTVRKVSRRRVAEVLVARINGGAAGGGAEDGS